MNSIHTPIDRYGFPFFMLRRNFSSVGMVVFFILTRDFPPRTAFLSPGHNFSSLMLFLFLGEFFYDFFFWVRGRDVPSRCERRLRFRSTCPTHVFIYSTYSKYSDEPKKIPKSSTSARKPSAWAEQSWAELSTWSKNIQKYSKIFTNFDKSRLPRQQDFPSLPVFSFSATNRRFQYLSGFVCQQWFFHPEDEVFHHYRCFIFTSTFFFPSVMVLP